MARHTAHKAALTWHSYGIACIPIAYRSKRPTVDSWTKYQTELPTKAELLQWFGLTKLVNLAVVTGWDGLTVIDFDNHEAYGAWQVWAMDGHSAVAELAVGFGYHVMTGRGCHVYVKIRVGAPRSGPLMRGLIDIKGAGGYVLAPPSVHPSGARYKESGFMDAIPVVPDLQSLFPFDVSEATKPKPARIPVTLPAPLPDDPWAIADDPKLARAVGIQQIKDTLGIVDLAQMLGLDPEPRKDHGWYLCRCPLHNDHNPSFWLNSDQNIGGCYAGCTDKPLDVIGLYAAAAKVGTADAIATIKGWL